MSTRKPLPAFTPFAKFLHPGIIAGMYFQGSLNSHFTNPFWIDWTPLTKVISKNYPLQLQLWVAVCNSTGCNRVTLDLDWLKNQSYCTGALTCTLTTKHTNSFTAGGLSVRLPSLDNTEETLLDFSAKSCLLSFLKSMQKMVQYSLMTERKCLHAFQDRTWKQPKNRKKGTNTGTILLEKLHYIQMNVCVLVLPLFPVIGWISGFVRLIEINKAWHLMFRGFYH